MRISGVEPYTLLDYPGSIACIVYLPGCNMRCGFCHNPEFVLPAQIKNIASSFLGEDVFFSFLQTRIAKLDGVVISGGEPTICPELLPFMKKIKELGFSIKLDTNGLRPDVVASGIDLGLIDYIAIDIKAPLAMYADISEMKTISSNIKKTLEIVREHAISYELRTTVIKDIHSIEILKKMAKEIGEAPVWYLQTFRPQVTLSERFSQMTGYTEREMREIQHTLQELMPSVLVR